MASPDSDLEEDLAAHILSPIESDYAITDMIHIASNISVKFEKTGENGELIQRYLSALRKTQGSVLVSDSTFEKISVRLLFS